MSTCKKPVEDGPPAYKAAQAEPAGLEHRIKELNEREQRLQSLQQQLQTQAQDLTQREGHLLRREGALLQRQRTFLEQRAEEQDSDPSNMRTSFYDAKLASMGMWFLQFFVAVLVLAIFRHKLTWKYCENQWGLGEYTSILPHPRFPQQDGSRSKTSRKKY